MSLDAIHDICTYLVLNLVNKKYWDDPCCENEILVYMDSNSINRKVELVPWFKTWFVNLFGFVFCKMKVLEWPLSRKWDFSLYGLKFDKYEGWICLSMSLDTIHDICTYLVLNLVNKKYWDDPCCENEILVYMDWSLINMKDEFVSRWSLTRNMIFVPIWF